MEQAPAILVMERLDALWEASAQALDVAIFVDFFTTPFQPTPIFFPTFFPAPVSYTHLTLPTILRV